MNQLLAKTRVCANCRCRFALERQRCPRCRTVVSGLDARPSSAHSRWMTGAAGGMLGAFGLVIGLFWLTLEPAALEYAGTPADPLAARRKAPPSTGADDAGFHKDETRARALVPVFDEPWPDAVPADTPHHERVNLTDLEDSVAADPDHANAHGDLGHELAGLERFDEAIAHLKRAVDLEPDQGARRASLARALAAAGRWSDSVAEYREAERLLPFDPITRFDLGLALHRSGDDAAAVDAYGHAIGLDPSNASFRIALAVSHERLQHYDDAAAAYGEYLRLAPAGPEAERARIRIAQLSEW
jgi:tetratricopeptide (TPR) repeat protein